MNKDAQQHFRLGSWRTTAEAQQWAAAVVVDVIDLVGMLDVVVARGAPADADRQALRRAVFHALVLRQPSETLFRPAARALRTASPEGRALLVELLPRLNCVADHGELIDLLRLPDGDVRAAAARVLIEVGSKAAVTTLSPLLFDRGFPGFREGLEVVARVGGVQATPILERLLQRPDATERLLAIRWLGDPRVIGRHSGVALRALQPLLKDSHESIGIAAAIAIGQVASEAEYHEILVPLTEVRIIKLVCTII